MSLLTRPAAMLAAHRRTIFFWLALIVVVFALLSYNKTTQAHTVARLNSTDVETRDNVIQSLVQNGKLVDTLATTQDPNTDAKSPQNVASATLRENAVDSVNRLAAAHKITDSQALETLFMLRKDTDKPVRDTATAGIATLGALNDTNLRAIVDNLRNGDPDIRSAAIDALGKISGDKAAKLVDPLTRNQETTDAAQQALLKIGASSVPYLLAHLATPSRTFKQSILVVLGQIASPTAIPALLQIAADPDPSVHRLAVSSLANTILNSYTTLQKAQAALVTANADPKAKRSAIAKATKAVADDQATFTQTNTAAPPLVAALKNPEDDSQARTQSALALGRVGGPAAIAALVKALGDYDASVRAAALQGVQSVGAPADPVLTAALTGGAVDTEASAAQALGNIGSPSSLPVLSRLVSNTATPVSVRRAAVFGMGQSGNTSVIPTLVAALADPDGTVASAASDALQAPDLEAQAVPSLVASFAGPDPVPFNASQTLSRMGNLAVHALQTAALSPNPRLQTWAAVTLGLTDSKDPAITASLTPLTHSVNPGVQYAASQALSRLAGI